MKNDFGKLIANTAERWIQDYNNAESGTLHDWNKKKIEEFRHIPVETLLMDDYFLGLKDTVYPGVWEDIIDLWEERSKRSVNQAYFLEGIGSGKSMKSSIINWLLWYELCMHESPQKHFGLIHDSVIAVMLLSRTETQSRRVVFGYTWDRFQSGFNKDYFPVSPRFTREIRIERNNTCVYAGTSSALSALGYNVYSATIDEANFLEVTEDSKRSNEEIYDAAEEMFNAVYNRMSSRFMKDGVIPGIICMISSPQYPDSFMERKIAEIKAIGLYDLNAFWSSRSTWEAKGPKYFPDIYERGEYFLVDTETMEIKKEINDPKKAVNYSKIVKRLPPV